MTFASDIDTEVLVVGGGIAGSVAAVGFATEGFTTSLLDTSAPDAPGREYALRVSSINLNSEKILRDMGIWPLIEQGRVSPFERIMVWDDGHEDPLCFDAADVGLGHLAHIVENDLVAWAAHSRLGELSAFQPVDPGRVSEVGRRDGFVEVRTDAGKVHRCRLLVAADGASSSVRRLAGIERRTFDYRQRAIVARVLTEQHHGFAARQKFLATGPLAFLPLADGSCSIVWSLDTRSAETLERLDDETFSAKLTDAFDRQLGTVTVTGARRSFPLKRSHAREYVREGIALVGDACHTVHPLAGLGANQGIADAEALLEVVCRARSRGQQYDAPRTLLGYQRRRRPANSATLATMDLFHLGFANDNALLSRLRTAVFAGVEKSAAAKRFFINNASGLTP